MSGVVSESPVSRTQIAVATLSCVALGSLFLPWFTGWVPFSLDNPLFMLVPVRALETWAGWGIAVFDGLLFVLAIACVRQRVLSVQWWFAAGAILALGVEGLVRVAVSSPDLEARMRALGPPRFDWSWLRLELALPVMANVGVLLLCRQSRNVQAPSE